MEHSGTESGLVFVLYYNKPSRYRRVTTVSEYTHTSRSDRDNYSVFLLEIQVFRGDMVDDLQEYREDSGKHQNDTTESENRRLTPRLDKSLNSCKQKAPVLDDNLY